jgi:hypothetical protein
MPPLPPPVVPRRTDILDVIMAATGCTLVEAVERLAYLAGMLPPMAA